MIRAEASREIGTGHVMRCLTLAACLRESGDDVTFACTSGPGDMADAIRSAGFRVLAAREPVSREIDLLIVDDYRLDHRYESSMRHAARRILAIDDLADRRHDCDVLLDQNLYADMHERYRSLVPAQAVTLLGPQYALLRPEFLEARRRREQRGQPRRLLVFFGGGDASNETLKTLRALRTLDLAARAIHTDVLIGCANDARIEIERQVAGMPGVSAFAHTDEIATLMLRADLAIGAGGTTTWERCCIGLPAIVIAVADNQVALSRAVADAGCQQYLGRSQAVTEQMIAAAVSAALERYDELRAGADRGMQLVDGRGARRVADVLRAS